MVITERTVETGMNYIIIGSIGREERESAEVCWVESYRASIKPEDLGLLEGESDRGSI